MSGTYKRCWCFLIRLYIGCNLIFFVSCQQSTEDAGIRIRWADKRATGLRIPRQLALAVAADSLNQRMAVRLAGNETSMLGQFQLADNDILFEPLIPLTRGLHYTIWLGNKRLGEVAIPNLNPDDKPTVLGIYPTQDSLPENLLKIYLHFSRPMREGQSPKYVAILKNKNDTLPGVLLDLQPELWNADRTLLTLWLDPGRIKRDLQPNKRLGAPLQTGVPYQIVVSANWPDTQGATLGRSATKSFVTVPRDSLSPDPEQWSINQPKQGSLDPLEVTFGEPLDYSLLTETLHVIDEEGRAIAGKWQPVDEEKRGLFKPVMSWNTGQYRLKIESRLEDLAGNNLNRPFDRDITRKNKSPTPHLFVDMLFRVK